jgi:hypothetical protein
MVENKTAQTRQDVAAFLDAVPDPERREDARALAMLMARAVGEPPAMWGANIVGFGRYRYKYESGREGEAMIAGFSPRAKELVLYLMADAPERDALLARLGKHRTGKACLYIKRLADVDQAALEELVAASARAVREQYPKS